nr:permease [Caldichromatium japonicum]
MFLFLALELSLLFLAVSFLVDLLRRRLSETTIQHWVGDGRPRSYLLAAGLGAITPFCSCSTIPMLKGLIDARAGFGPMMVFLFTSPLLNPSIVVLLAVTFGWSLTGIYFMAALLFSLVAGWLLQHLGFRREIRAETTTVSGECCAGTAGGVIVTPPSCGGAPETSRSQACTLEVPTTGAAVTGGDGCTRMQPDPGFLRRIWQETWADFVRVLPYLILGVAIGSLIMASCRPVCWSSTPGRKASGRCPWRP